ncbi:unnamed protein product [Vicia faba]|uniref:Transcription repressor n=1 Tax=Vicia faba TaxID=3906 RepID=A0AAV1BAJ3_VICFA|nr:unnamed protein product [Vicia faba]
MKWGGRKASSAAASSSSKPSFISHVSPFTWLSKFKQMKINSDSETKPEKPKQNAASDNSSSQFPHGNRGRFYRGGDGDDDAFWRLSFGEEVTDEQKKKSKDIMKPIVYNSEAKRNGRRRRREDKDLMNETKSAKELEYLKKRYERKAQKVIQDQLLKLQNTEEEEQFASSKCKSLEKDELQFESPRTRLFSPYVDAESSNLGLGSIRENGMKQCDEFKVKGNKKRESVHVSRELHRRKPKQSSKVRVHSPKMATKVEICKIKAIEDKKKAKLKMKKQEEIVEETEKGLDSFAVVKRSLDPQQDFRDSMIEMIKEKQISEPEEMEELLACYLSLNSNEYHDLIIKVFRQVWLYMSQSSLCTKSDKQCCYYD